MRVNADIGIARRSTQVYAYVADLGLIVEWLPGAREVERLTGDAGQPGARYRIVARERPRTVAYEIELIEAEPGRRLVLESRTVQVQGGSGATQFIYDFWSEGEDRTRVTLVMTGAVPRRFRWLEPLLRWFARRSARGYLASLKRTLEAEG